LRAALGCSSLSTGFLSNPGQEPFVPDMGDVIQIQYTLDPHTFGLTGGTYLVEAIIDDADQVREQDEGNNYISALLTIEAYELHPTSLRFDRPVVRLDEEVRVTSEIANDGTGLAKSVLVEFYINGVRFGTARLDQLGAVAETASATLNPSRLGLSDTDKVYQLSVVVDPDNALPESDEANNELVRTLTILPPQPKKAEIHPESLILSPASPVEKSPANDTRGHNTVTVSSVVRNTGRAPTGPFHADFSYRVKGSQRWTSFGCDGTQACPPVELEAGIDTTLVRTLDVRQLPTGIYEIRVKVDSDMAVDELDENNNELVTTLTLLSSRLADLSADGVLAVTPSNQVKQGQGIDLAIAVTNQGDLAAGPFEVSLSYCKMVWGTTPEETVNCAIDGQFVPVAMEAVLGGLGIGERAVVEFEMETVNLNPGQYFLRIDLDAGGDVPERNELDNALSTVVLVQGPDLVAQGIQAEWGPVDRDEDGETDGEAVYVTAQLSNIGILPAGDFVIGFYYAKVESGTEPTATCLGSSAVPCELSGEFGMIPMEGLDVGAPPPTRIVGCRWDPELLGLGPGTYILGVFVDAEDTVREHNELNNRAEIPFELPAPPEAADLAALWLEADLVPLDENEDGVVDREVVDVAVRLGNIGVVPAGDFVIEFYYVPLEPGTQGEVTCAEDPETLCEPGPVFGTVELLGLDVGAEVTARCRLEPDRLELAKPGTYVLGATIDAGDWVFEQDEENNRAELLFVLPGPPDGGTPTATGADLVALSLFARRSSSDPDDLRAWATIGNHGIHDVGPFEVAFYYTPENDPDPVFSVANVPGLAAGATVTLLRTFDITGLAAGHYLVGVIADPEDLLHEPNEENNAQETRLRLY